MQKRKGLIIKKIEEESVSGSLRWRRGPSCVRVAYLTTRKDIQVRCLSPVFLMLTGPFYVPIESTKWERRAADRLRTSTKSCL